MVLQGGLASYVPELLLDVLVGGDVLLLSFLPPAQEL